MSSKNNQNLQYVFDPATVSIREWAWSKKKIGLTPLEELQDHYAEFKKKKSEIISFLGDRNRFYLWGSSKSCKYKSGREVEAVAPSNPKLLKFFIHEFSTWFPSENPLKFYDWCYDYEWTVRGRIRYLEREKLKRQKLKSDGIERHPGKNFHKRRRSLNKGKAKKVSSRNYDRLQRKWERNVLKSLDAGDLVSAHHPNFVLSRNGQDKFNRTLKAQHAHLARMEKRHKADLQYTALRKAELSKQKDKVA